MGVNHSAHISFFRGVCSFLLYINIRMKFENEQVYMYMRFRLEDELISSTIRQVLLMPN